MKLGDLVKHCKYSYLGVIISIKDDYAEVLWLNPSMYNPELFNINELEVVNG